MNVLSLQVEDKAYKDILQELSVRAESTVFLLLKLRQELRAEGNFELADKIRSSLWELGLLVEGDKKCR